MPSPEGTFDDLRAVSCLSSTACTAVGQANNTEDFAEHWDGTKWVLQTMAVASEGTGTFIEGVSCVEPSHEVCYAVGSNGENKPFVELGTTPPPAATTEPATSVTYTEATLKGSVNPNSVETKYYFEYGPTTSYGTKTVETSAGAGKSNIASSQPITGLTQGTTYHFRIVATNSVATTRGGDRSFTTASPSWAIASTPNPTGTLSSYLWGASCRTTSECMAVGSY